MMWLDRRLKVAVNPNVIDKNEGGHHAHMGHGWLPMDLLPEELASLINEGMAFCPQVNVLAVDIDGGTTIDGHPDASRGNRPVVPCQSVGRRCHGGA